MDTYYLVPVSEYARKPDIGPQSSAFDKVTESIVENPNTGTTEKAEALRDSLGNYLNYRTASKAQFDENLGKLVTKTFKYWIKATSDTPKEVIEPTKNTEQKPSKITEAPKKKESFVKKLNFDTESYNESDGGELFETPRAKTLTKSQPRKKLDWVSDVRTVNILPSDKKRTRNIKQKGEGRKKKKQTGGWITHI